MLHLMKLAVGIRSLDELSAPPDGRRSGPPRLVLTRQMPKRAAELLDGGCLYWVIANAFGARQRILGIAEGADAAGTKRVRITLAPEVGLVLPRQVRPFQGWRYLRADGVPPELSDRPAAGVAADMPAAMRLELETLGLL